MEGEIITQTTLAKLRQEQANEIMGAMYPYKRTRQGIKIMGKPKHDILMPIIIVYNKKNKTRDMQVALKGLHMGGWSYGQLAKIYKISKNKVWRLINSDYVDSRRKVKK